MMRWYVLEKIIKERGYTIGAELGVWRGKTYKHLLSECSNLTLIGVDLYEPQPDSEGPEKWVPGENGHEWDHDKYYRDIQSFQNKIGERARFYKMTTLDAAKEVEDASLDFVFIDADHSYEGVKNDIAAWSPKVRNGGCVIGHDIDWDPVLQAVTEEFGSDFVKLDDNVWCVNK